MTRLSRSSSPGYRILHLTALSDTTVEAAAWDRETFGNGITAQEAAQRFGWSLGVASEELDMAEQNGALCRDGEGMEGVDLLGELDCGFEGGGGGRVCWGSSWGTDEGGGAAGAG